MKDREEINILPGIKGIFVRAEACEMFYSNWLLLISHVTTETREEDGENYNLIYSYVCKDITSPHNIAELCDDVKKTPFEFGDASHYKFYRATEKEKNVIINMLKAKKYKYIKVINKVIDR